MSLQKATGVSVVHKKIGFDTKNKTVTFMSYLQRLDKVLFTKESTLRDGDLFKLRRIKALKKVAEELIAEYKDFIAANHKERSEK